MNITYNNDMENKETFDDEIRIIDSSPEFMPQITQVLKTTWLATYPNEEHGISKEDVESRFLPDESEEGKKIKETRIKRYEDPNYHQWVAKDGEEIVGICTAAKEGDHGRIQAIYVLSTCQGKKVGKKLMEAGLSWLGNQDVYINVVSYNQKAINFYEKFGFVKTGKEARDAAALLPSGKIMPEIEMVKKVEG